MSEELICIKCIRTLSYNPLLKKSDGRNYKIKQIAFFCLATNKQVTRFKTQCSKFANTRLELPLICSNSIYPHCWRCQQRKGCKIRT